MIDELRDFVPNVHFELIPIRDLVSNQEYQRNLSWGHVKKAVDNFDLNQINPIKVSRRNGTNYVFKLKVKMVNSSVEEENKKGESKEDTNLNKPIVEEPPEESDEALTEETLYEDYSSSVNLTLDVESQSLEEVP